MKSTLALAIFLCLFSCNKKAAPETEGGDPPKVVQSEKPNSEVETPDTECVENLKEDCICTAHVDPVCGCNGKTYTNKCKAECAGIMEYTKGPCPD